MTRSIFFRNISDHIEVGCDKLQHDLSLQRSILLRKKLCPTDAADVKNMLKEQSGNSFTLTIFYNVKKIYMSGI